MVQDFQDFQDIGIDYSENNPVNPEHLVNLVGVVLNM